MIATLSWRDATVRVECRTSNITGLLCANSVRLLPQTQFVRHMFTFAAVGHHDFGPMSLECGAFSTAGVSQAHALLQVRRIRWPVDVW